MTGKLIYTQVLNIEQGYQNEIKVELLPGIYLSRIIINNEKIIKAERISIVK
jgi:hypothetical protein